ncbi:MAG: class I SAM-dependent methyltransferase [Alphaproteobacteria bacterium]
MMRRRNTDVLLELVDFQDRIVVDVGSGDGGLARLMTRQGAHVTGIEISERQIEAAFATPRQGDETYIEGSAESLPFADSSVDIVVFFNSLHHVAVERMDTAMAESARVLKPGGLLYVTEPLAEGSFFDLCCAVDDETAVRARALACIRSAARFGLTAEKEVLYIHTVVMRDYDSFRERIIAPNVEREPIVERLDASLRAAFQRLGTPTSQGMGFDQPSRANLLRRTA